MRKLFMLGISFTVCGPLAAEELGSAFAGFSIHEMAGFETPSGQFFGVGTLTGSLDFENNESVLEHAAFHCVQEFQVNGSGHCAIVTRDEGIVATSITGANLSHLWMEYSCIAAATGGEDCRFKVVEGAGRFKGATGTATARYMGEAIGHPGGFLSDYAIFSSFDLNLAE